MTIIELLPLDLFGSADTDVSLSQTTPEAQLTESCPFTTEDSPLKDELVISDAAPAQTDHLPVEQDIDSQLVTEDPLSVEAPLDTIDYTEDKDETDVENEEEHVKAFYTDEEADQVAVENEKLVYYVANRFRSTGISVEELSSVGFLGYAKAIKTFDKNRNVKFSTYAINVIKNEICYFLRKESKHMRKNVSLNTILSTDQNGNPFELSDIIDNEDAAPLDEDIMVNDRRDMLFEVIQRLSPKEQYIIMNRFELAGNEKKTQKQISEEINMSQANVSKLQKNAIRKLEFYLQLNMKDRDLTLNKALEL